MWETRELKNLRSMEVCRYTGSGEEDPYDGKYYVRAWADTPQGPDRLIYLHTDGRWRRTTAAADRSFTGYFDSRKSARSALQAATSLLA